MAKLKCEECGNVNFAGAHAVEHGVDYGFQVMHNGEGTVEDPLRLRPTGESNNENSSITVWCPECRAELTVEAGVSLEFLPAEQPAAPTG
jgi:ribosomal protein S27E